MNFLLSLLATLLPTTAFAIDQWKMLVSGGTESAAASTDTTVDTFLQSGQSYIFGLLAVVAVGVFIWLGYRLFTAQGNEEEFKKVWIAFTYAVIGLAIVPLAFAVVRIVLGFTI